MGLKEFKLPIGARSSYFWPIIGEAAAAHPTYGAKVDMGANVKAAITVTAATLEYYADDELLVYDEKYTSHQLDAETAKSELEINALLYGHTYDNGEELSGGEDSPATGAYGFIEPILLKDKTLKFRSTFLYKNTAMLSAEKQEANTKNTAVTPVNNAVSFRGAVDNAGKWRARKDFNTQADAEAYLDACAGSTDKRLVTFELRGSGSASPAAGAYMTENNGSFTATLSDTPTAVYKTVGTTTTEISSSVVNKVLTVSGITADTQILVVF